MLDIKKIIVSSIVFLSLDYIYLSSQTNYFKDLFKILQKTPLKFRMSGAILCYIVLLFSLNFFILHDKKKTIIDAFILGFVIYAVYETTNYATFTEWPIKMIIMDTLWGGVLFALTYYLTNKIIELL